MVITNWCVIQTEDFIRFTLDNLVHHSKQLIHIVRWLNYWTKSEIYSFSIQIYLFIWFSFFINYVFISFSEDPFQYGEFSFIHSNKTYCLETYNTVDKNSLIYKILTIPLILITIRKRQIIFSKGPLGNFIILIAQLLHEFLTPYRLSAT